MKHGQISAKFLLVSSDNLKWSLSETHMTAPSQKQDGMGSLLYPDNTVRFRVWAPFASSADVVLFDPGPGTTTVALANEPGTRNWSADGIPAVANTRYQYVITTAPGQDNDTSVVH